MRKILFIAVAVLIVGGLVFAGFQPGVQEWVRGLPGIRALWPGQAATWDEVPAMLMAEHPGAIEHIWHWRVVDTCAEEDAAEDCELVGYAVVYIAMGMDGEATQTLYSYIYRAGRRVGLDRVVVVDTYQGGGEQYYPYTFGCSYGEQLANWPEDISGENVSAYLEGAREHGWGFHARQAVAYWPMNYFYLYFPVDESEEAFAGVVAAAMMLDDEYQAMVAD